jgi:ribosomal protein S18 acetylase RimI-like enzyme
MTQWSQNEINLRTLNADDWRLWRELRLEALAEAPYAFGSTLADWQGPNDSETRWRGRLSDVPLNLIAEWRKTPAGMASATTPDGDASVELISMWVAPFARGHGVGDSLVAAILDWAREQRASRVVLAVFVTNDRASTFYRRHGFQEVGEVPGTTSGNAPQRKMVHDLLPGLR